MFSFTQWDVSSACDDFILFSRERIRFLRVTPRIFHHPFALEEEKKISLNSIEFSIAEYRFKSRRPSTINCTILIYAVVGGRWYKLSFVFRWISMGFSVQIISLPSRTRFSLGSLWAVCTRLAVQSIDLDPLMSSYLPFCCDLLHDKQLIPSEKLKKPQIAANRVFIEKWPSKRGTSLSYSTSPTSCVPTPVLRFSKKLILIEFYSLNK